MERQQDRCRWKRRKDSICCRTISGSKPLEIESGQKSWFMPKMEIGKDPWRQHNSTSSWKATWIWWIKVQNSKTRPRVKTKMWIFILLAIKSNACVDLLIRFGHRVVKNTCDFLQVWHFFRVLNPIDCVLIIKSTYKILVLQSQSKWQKA